MLPQAKITFAYGLKLKQIREIYAITDSQPG